MLLLVCSLACVCVCVLQRWMGKTQRRAKSSPTATCSSEPTTWPRRKTLLRLGRFCKSSLLVDDSLTLLSVRQCSLTLSANDKILLTGEETSLSFAPVAAIETSSLVVLPSAEYDHEAIQHALKVEPCSIVGSGAANFKRV